MVLIAGPYRSGTGDDPALLAANERAMHVAALELFRRGHLPVTGEALALPLIRAAAEQAAAAPAAAAPAAAAPAAAAAPGSPLFDEIFHPIARRLVARCDAVLRIGGASAGADEMVAIARAHGAAIVHDIDDLRAPAPDAPARDAAAPDAPAPDAQVRR